MSERNRYWLSALLLLVLIIIAIVYLLVRQGEEKAKSEGLGVIADVNVPERNEKFSLGVEKPSVSVKEEDGLEEYVCAIRKELCLDDPISAATKAEARWLKQFGYPSHRRLEQLEAMSLSELEVLSHKGDLSARVVLGRKRIEMKDHIAGRSDLMGALLDGSTYAAIEMARSNTPDIPSSSLSEARAYYRVAYLLGDWKAPREAYISQQKYGGFDSWEMVRSDERAMELYRNILKYRGENHIPLRVWPRP